MVGNVSVSLGNPILKYQSLKMYKNTIYKGVSGITIAVGLNLKTGRISLRDVSHRPSHVLKII